MPPQMPNLTILVINKADTNRPRIKPMAIFETPCVTGDLLRITAHLKIKPLHNKVIHEGEEKHKSPVGRAEPLVIVSCQDFADALIRDVQINPIMAYNRNIAAYLQCVDHEAYVVPYWH